MIKYQTYRCEHNHGILSPCRTYAAYIRDIHVTYVSSVARIHTHDGHTLDHTHVIHIHA